MATSSNQDALRNFLLGDQTSGSASIFPHLDKTLAGKLVERIRNAPLFAHSYSHTLNFTYGAFTPQDLLKFASEHGLAGIHIHVNDGEERSLRAMDEAALRQFGSHARESGLRLYIETSTTALPGMTEATRIARHTGAESVRCYPRYAGRVSKILANAVADLKGLENLDSEGSLHYTVEQHEDLKSYELVEIIKKVDNPRVSLLFDFGNMVNAMELPDEALTIMEPYVTTVHVKDVTITENHGGQVQRGCKSGSGDINIPLLMFRLLLLGEDKPQVRAFGLEEEVGYVSPAFRFPDEESDPLIPFRQPSETWLSDTETLAARLARERVDAVEQIIFIRSLLGQMRSLATAIIND